MTDPKKNMPAELAEDQLSGVSGGHMNKIEFIQPVLEPGKQPIVTVQPMAFKYCAADPTHVYPVILDACPVCGCKEFTSVC